MAFICPHDPPCPKGASSQDYIDLGHMPWCDTKHGDELSCAGHLSGNGAGGKE